MTANARVLEHAIRKMLSHPLPEVRQIGLEVRQVALAETPTLVKYADALSYLTETGRDFLSLELETGNPLGSEVESDWCRLVDHDPEGEIKILSAALYRFGDMTYEETLQSLRLAGRDELQRLAALLLSRLCEHDAPLRELEHTGYTFDLVLDKGGYAELKRHRMMTQTPQLLTTRLGYACPRLFADAGLEASYRAAMEAAAEAYETLAGWDLQSAAYVVPNGFHRRVLLTMNLREAFAFCQLRAANNAHFSLRRIAQRIAAEIRVVHPLLAGYMHLPAETWQDVDYNFL